MLKAHWALLAGCLLPAVAVAQDKPAPARTVEPLDLVVTPKKFAGKDLILQGARCFQAEVGEYRCVAVSSTGDGVLVLAEKISNSEAQDWLDNNCDTVTKAGSSPRCTFTIRFRYDADDIEQEKLDTGKDRTAVKAEELTLDLPQARPRRR